MNLLVVTNLFPNAFEPRRGIFNLYQLQALASRVNVRVLAPSPQFPGMRLLGAMATSGRVGSLPKSATVDGLRVDYPRYAYVPRIGQRFHHILYARGIRGAFDAAVADHKPDAILATWSYPDVAAVVELATTAGLPAVAKVHGTDVNDYLEMKDRRNAILSALGRASRIVAVSKALKSRLTSSGVSEERIDVVYNGVDHAVFKPGSRADARSHLSLDAGARVVLFVGNLKPVKGIDVLLEAMQTVDASLVVIGQGALETQLRETTAQRGLERRVSFEGEKSHEEIARWIRASDLLCLPSRNEGVPNVLLEAMACGRPVVSTTVGGIPEVVSDQCGMLVNREDPGALSAAINNGLATDWDEDMIVAHASTFTWERSAEGIIATLEKATC